MTHTECALISGISLPMLIKAVNYQTLPLEKWVAEITESVLEWVIIEFKRNHLL
jgi:mannose/fructose-specific phosphotransferase system component IIA